MNWVNEREDGTANYTLVSENLSRYSSEADADKMGEMQEVEVFETEHHVYTFPCNYKNVKVVNWLEYNHKGMEIEGETGSITIEEENPIVSVTVVGSGCSGNNYNTVEWWGPGESLKTVRRTKAGQLIKRQRVANMQGQHNAFVQSAMTQQIPDFETVEDARNHIERMQNIFYNMTGGCNVPGSFISGLYENTATFRIGDTTRPEHTAHKVVVRGGGLDYEDPGTHIARYPADYAFRMIDLTVKK